MKNDLYPHLGAVIVRRKKKKLRGAGDGVFPSKLDIYLNFQGFHLCRSKMVPGILKQGIKLIEVGNLDIATVPLLARWWCLNKNLIKFSKTQDAGWRFFFHSE